MKSGRHFPNVTSILLATLLLKDIIFPLVASGNGRFQQPLRYHVNEESDENTIIGDVRKDFNKRNSNNNNNNNNKNDNNIHHHQPSFTFAFLKNSNQKFFKIDKTTGVVRTTSTRLDREAICSSNETCTIETDVIIYRNSSPQSMVKVMMEVVDVNDNHPVFPYGSITETVSESAEIGELATVRPATDKDSSTFGVVGYRLRDSFGGLFDISVVQGVDHKEESQVTILLRGSLDRESKDFYSLELIAADGGIPPKTSSMFLDLKVLDENDNSPVFQDLPYYSEIPENTITSNFFSVRALDKDLGDNGKVEYRLSRESAYRFGSDFHVDEITGSLQVLRPLDYELYDLAILVVVASDLGTYRRSSTASLTVSIIDLNDNSPEIDVIRGDAPLTGNDRLANVVGLEENSLPGTVVVSLHVLDLDSGLGGAVDCSVSPQSDAQEAFEISKITTNDFNLMTTDRAQVDRESKDRYFLVIVCRDSDIDRPLTSSLDLTIDIVDVNDNPPLIPDCPKEFVVKEGDEPALILGEIAAFDIDASENGTLEYHLRHYMPSEEMVDIHPLKGILRILATLDREAQDRHEFQVIVRDEGHLESTCDIVIKVTDVEDCDPLFEQPRYYFTLHGEHFNPLHPIGQVRAIDKDLYPANVITYTISGELEFPDWPNNDSSDSQMESLLKESKRDDKLTASPPVGIFDIKSNSGLIYTARPVRRTQRNVTHFVLSVVATSGIEQIGSATTEVYIDISRAATRHGALGHFKDETLHSLSETMNGLEEHRLSEDGAHYLKIPLLLGLTCVLVGMTIFVAIVIVQAICTKLTIPHPANNSPWNNDKHARPAVSQEDKPQACAGSNKNTSLNDIFKSRHPISTVLNLTRQLFMPVLSSREIHATCNSLEQRKDDEKVDNSPSLSKSYGSAEERQNCLIESFAASSSTSSQSLLYSPRRASGYKPSLSLKEVEDITEKYQTCTLPTNGSKDRRSSGYHSPSKSLFSSIAEDGGEPLKSSTWKSADSGMLEKKETSATEDTKHMSRLELSPKTAQNSSSMFRLFDNQRPSTFHLRSRVPERTNEDQRLNMNTVSPPIHKSIGRYLWYHDV